MPSLISFVMRADQRKWCAGSFGRSVAFSRKLGAEGFLAPPPLAGSISNCLIAMIRD
jgi:hypothetical protein